LAPSSGCSHPRGSSRASCGRWAWWPPLCDAFGEGDLRARADVRGADEIAAVAAEVNRMAERLAQYRASSLGELLQAQQGAQAAIDGLPDPVLLIDAGRAVQGRKRRGGAA
jgi:hypothetical protein